MLITLFCLVISEPNQTGLLFSSNQSGNSEIYVIREHGSPPVNLTRHESSDNWPVWSPDGKHILFQSRRTGKFDVWIMDANGENLRQLTTFEGHDYLPSWKSIDTFSFTSRRSLAGEKEAPFFFIQKLEGEPTQMVGFEPGNSTSCVWRDNHSFAYTQKDGETYQLVWVSGQQREVMLESSTYIGAGSWSPHGELAFSREVDGGTELGLLKVGSEPILLVQGMKAWYPRFSSDGKWIVFTAQNPESENDLDIYAISLEPNSKPILLYNSPFRDSEASWRP